MSFWDGRKVFITGHTGLRGSWLALSLQKAGAQVFGYALAPSSEPSLFEVANVGQGMNSTFSDIRDLNSLQSALNFAQAEVVFHLAGGGGLKDSWDRVADVYSAQVMGTIHLLESLRQTASVRAVVVLSSDKVYRSVEQVLPYSEGDCLGGSSPAATAKACSELIVESYLSGVFAPEKYNKHKIALATARQGAVIGGGDFSADSLMFQLAQACQAGLDLPLKNPDSVRPWMHVEDAVRGLLMLGQALLEKGPKVSGAWNLGAGAENRASVSVVKKAFMEGFQGRALTTDELAKGRSFHNALDCAKALKELTWKIEKDPIQAVQATAKWYRDYYS